MQKPESYRGLVVWQKGVDFVDAVYDAADGFPHRETYGLASQLTRAAVSVTANVAEGWGRSGPREYAHHVSIAHGSLLEAETLITVARRRRFIDGATEQRLLAQSAEVGRLLNGLLRSLQ